MSGSKRVKRLKAKMAEQAEVQHVLALKAVGYARVSTEEQATAGYGLEAQEKAIRAFAESQGYVG
jgi:site-specific DNA recombinase